MRARLKGASPQAYLTTHMPKLILTILLLSNAVSAVDHLEPENSAFSGENFSEYTELTLEYFQAAYADNVALRVIVTPSFSPEFAVGIKTAGDKYFIFYDASTMPLWEYHVSNQSTDNAADNVSSDEADNQEIEQQKKQLPENPMSLPRTTCEREIPRVLAKDIRYVWREMLYATRYRRVRAFGRDGETYHFSASTDGGVLAGKVWSPDPSSKTGQLVDISRYMADYCRDKSSNATKLIKKVRHLHSLLSASQLKSP